MEVLLLTVMGVANILCFIIGAKVGQTVSKGEKVEMPSINPIKAIHEAQERKEAEREQDRISKIMANIDSYDGTGYGQQEVT
jgi:hypothetical protein